MGFRSSFQRLSVYASIAVLLTACAAPGQVNNRQGPSGSAASEPCDTTRSALAGAAAGAILGALIGGKQGAATGVLAGGALGAAACYSMNVQSRQTKTAAQADADYQRARGALPASPTVVAYTPMMLGSTVQRGQKFKINSSLEVVNGRSEPVTEVREELVIYNPDGSQIQTGSKPFSAAGSGRFDNSFEVGLPANASQGVYALKTNVYVNGKIGASRDLRTQLVWNGTSGVLVATN